MTAVINPDLSIAGQVAVVAGSTADWPLVATSGGVPMAFASGDTITALVYGGQAQGSLFAPAAAWTGGTGYATGAFTVSPTSAQTAGLDPLGDYTLHGIWTSADLTRTAVVRRAQLLVYPAPGTQAQTITPYCKYQDMLDIADWVSMLQENDVDTEGFYVQRLRAREWMDWNILNNYRGAYVGLYEEHSVMAFQFGYAGWRRSLGPSPTLLTYLQSNFLIVRPQIIRACAHYACSLIALKQVGVNNQYANWGAYHRDMASRTLAGTTAEIDVDGDGIGEQFINLGSVNVLFT